MWIELVANQALWAEKRVALDGVASGAGPRYFLSRWGVKSRKPERGERDRERQRQGHDPRSGPITPGRGSAARRARDQGPAGTEQAGFSGKPGMLVHAMPKLEARRQAKLHSIMLSVKASARRMVWKLPSETKVDGGGDSRTGRTTKCACCKSVADAGKTHLPGQAKRAARFVEQAWDSLTRRSTGDSGADSRWAIRVRGERGRTSQGARASLLRSRGRRSNQQRRPGFWCAVVLIPRWQAWILAGRGLTGSSEERSVLPPPRDRGRQRSGSSGEASSADGRGRSAAAAVAAPAKGCRQYAAPAGAG